MGCANRKPVLVIKLRIKDPAKASAFNTLRIIPTLPVGAFHLARLTPEGGNLWPAATPALPGQATNTEAKPQAPLPGQATNNGAAPQAVRKRTASPRYNACILEVGPLAVLPQL